MAMAILGALAQDGVSITLPQITGRREPQAKRLLAGLKQARKVVLSLLQGVASMDRLKVAFQ